ncbi:MAG TPA: hypothetical protein VHH32_02185 [Gemmatimonadales bacterium]|nr:hypothetical protein [Gemmatimonadales bacterium]
MTRIRALGSVFCLLVGCDGPGATTDIGRLPDRIDSTPTPPTPADTATPGDSLPPLPPPDTTAPTPDTTGSGTPPVHEGIPFGPYFVPPDLYGPQYTGTYRPRQTPATLLSDLEAARRTNTRVILNLTGNEHYLRDEKGFSFEKWKNRVDGFRGLDFSSYIADGTIIGHLVLEEPTDRTNWNGHMVSPAQLDELARYSKELWPNMATIVRAWPDYLIGHTYKYLDATWAQYCPHCGSTTYRLPIEAFIPKMVREARAVGLALVGGLNVLDGGSGSSGIPGNKVGKFAMSAKEIKTWGEVYLAEPYICGFLMWEYEEKYFSRSDIKAVLAELRDKAKNHPKKECRP